MSKDWGRGIPTAETNLSGAYSSDLAFASRVKAVHHWIRRGNADKAAMAARAALHQAAYVLARMDGRLP